jgi:hypothetical protein
LAQRDVSTNPRRTGSTMPMAVVQQDRKALP